MKLLILPKITGLPIIEKYMPIGHPNRPGTTLTPPVFTAIVIHETANFNPGASDTMNVAYASRAYKTISGNDFEADGKTPFRYGAAQPYVDADSVTLTIPLNEVSYNCGDRPLKYDAVYKGQKPLARTLFNNKQNSMVLGVEMCDNKDWTKVQANTIEFIAQLVVVNKIPTPKIIRHFDVTGKPCPSRMLDDKVFAAFVAKITARINILKGGK